MVPNDPAAGEKIVVDAWRARLRVVRRCGGVWRAGEFAGQIVAGGDGGEEEKQEHARSGFQAGVFFAALLAARGPKLSHSTQGYWGSREVLIRAPIDYIL